MELFTKRVLKMMLATLLAMFFCATPALAAEPQSEQKIAISVKDMPMRQFLAEIERQCNYSFFYSNSVLNDAPNVTVNANGLELGKLLHQVFDGTALTFEFVGNKIAIKRSAVPQNPTGGGYNYLIINDFQTRG